MTARKSKHLIPCLLLAISACASRQPGDPLRPGLNLFSKEQDIQLGREAAAQARQQLPIVQDQALQSYIDGIGRRLASQPDAGDFPYSFTLVNDKQINAFALPGGPTFINTGLITNADNEAQLAGVMAHEIAHVALRHGTNQASKANLIQLPAMIAGGVLGGGGSLLGQLAQIGIGLGANSILLKYSRDAERQADALGARMMAGAGYNPIEMARFFEKLEAQGGSGGPDFLASHPSPGNRIELVQAEIRFLPASQYTAGSTGEFQTAKARVAKLPAPPAGQRGLQSAQSSPSGPVGGGFRELQTQKYAIAHPGNWQTFGDPNSGSVTIAPREGLVQGAGGNVSVGYGVMTSYFFPENNRANLRQATQDLVHHLHANNPGMQVSGGQRQVRVSGSQGLITTLTSQSPFGGAETDVLLTVARPEGLFYMVLVAPAREMASLEPVFQQMLQSLRFR